MDAEHLIYHNPKPRSDSPRDLVLTPLKLIGKIAALIPSPRAHRHRYYGVLAPNSPMRAAVTALAPLPVVVPLLVEVTAADAPPRRAASHYLWAMLLARIYEALPLMSRMMQANVIATSGRAVEAAGDVDVLLLDKTGTITLGNRQASAFMPAPGITEAQLADVAQLASLADETPEGRSVVILAKQRFNIREREMAELNATFVSFTAQTRMSGIDIGERKIRKGAADALKKYVESLGRPFPAEVARTVDDIARRGSTPLVVVDDGRMMGTIELKDIVKGGIKERFAELRRMGIKTVMITGDNKLTAVAIAAEAGVDDFLAEATPEEKLKLIRSYQAQGRLVAMTGDGTQRCTGASAG